jgi:hypothetical protein
MKHRTYLDRYCARNVRQLRCLLFFRRSGPLKRRRGFSKHRLVAPSVNVFPYEDSRSLRWKEG